MARKKKGDTDYVNNKDFTNEIVKCKVTGELSSFAVDCFMAISNRAIDKLHFDDPRDREDCIQSALIDCVKYWKSFDITVSQNAFAYFTQTAKNGYAKEWKKIHKKTGLDKGDPLSFISLGMSGESSIYSI